MQLFLEVSKEAIELKIKGNKLINYEIENIRV